MKIISKNVLLCGAEKFTSEMNEDILKCTITISFLNNQIASVALLSNSFLY